MIRFLQTPGPVKKIVLSGLLVVICIAMLYYLIPSSGGSTFGGSNASVVATVSGSDITADEVRREAQQMVRQQAAQLGPNAAMLMPMLMAQATPRAADNLISRKALMAEAERMGLRATPEEVKDDLQHGRYAATFFPGGNFVGQKQYEDMLSSANLTPSAFEDIVSKEIALGKLRAMVADSASVSESEIREAFDKQNRKVKFDYALLKQEDLRKGLHPADEELKAYYQSHLSAYANSVPEKRKAKYVVVDTGRQEAGVQVTPDDEQAYYDSHRDAYRVPEQVKIAHILIKTPAPGPDGKVDDKAVAAAQGRAQDLLKQIKAGANFEDLAKKNSEDPGSATQGGSLGWIGRGRTVPEFEKAAFSLAKGQTSDLVKTSYGFHIIRVDDKQDAHLKAMDEVRSQIEPVVKHQKSQQMAQKIAEQVRDEAKSKGLEAAAAAHGLTVVNSDFISRRDLLPGLGPAPQFMDALFLATDKTGVEVASASQGFVVYHLEGVKPPGTPTFDEIRTKVEDEFKNERASSLLAQKTQELSDRAKSEHDLKRAARELGATVKSSDFVAPDGQVPDLGSMSGQASVAFGLKAGEISAPINSGSNGAVLQVIETQAPTEADYAAKRDQIHESLLQQKQQQMFGLYIDNLRERMEKSGKIKVNQQEMKALSAAGNGEGM